MVNINYANREVTVKVVYYGPGLSGKTASLEYLYRQIPAEKRGKLLSLESEQDRTIFFDLLPVDAGTVNGFQVRIQLFTVPGSIKYEETRKLLLRSADGLVFVVDSQASMMDFNIESLKSMKENLKANRLDFDTIPLVIQYNKQDLGNLSSVEDINSRLNARQVPTFLAAASTGQGVMETYNAIIEKVLESLQKRLDKGLPPLSAPRTRPKEPIGPDHIRIVAMRKSPVDVEEEEKIDSIAAEVPSVVPPADFPTPALPQLPAQQMEIMEDIRLRVNKLLADNQKIAGALKKILIQMNEISEKLAGKGSRTEDQGSR